MEAVVFQIGAQRCALELGDVEEVIPLGPITPVPRLATGLVGAMNVRGEVIAVLDPCAAPGAGRRPTSAGLGVLARIDGCRVVLCVDRIEGILPTSELGTPEPRLIELPLLLRAILLELERAPTASPGPGPGGEKP